MYFTQWGWQYSQLLYSTETLISLGFWDTLTWAQTLMIVFSHCSHPPWTHQKPHHWWKLLALQKNINRKSSNQMVSSPAPFIYGAAKYFRELVCTYNFIASSTFNELRKPFWDTVPSVSRSWGKHFCVGVGRGELQISTGIKSHSVFYFV